MIIAGIPVFDFLYQKMTGNCIICGKRMVSGIGYFHVYKKYPTPNKKTPNPKPRTKYRFFCKEDCVILYALRKEG